MALFSKKKEKKLGRGFIPIDRVRELSSRGFTEPEMIDVLRNEGFSPEEIDRAFTQALRAGIANKPKETETKSELPTIEQLIPEKKKDPELEVPESSVPQEYYEQYSTEDYVNALVEGRISEVDDKIKEISLKYQAIEKEINLMRNQLNELTKVRTGEQQQILSRIDDFSSSIEEVNMRMASLEKAFKETLPALIESVRALSDLVQRLKRES